MCIEKLFLRWDNDHLLIAKNFVKIKQKYNARYFLYLFIFCQHQHTVCIQEKSVIIK